ncbi:hypothetical protein N9L68_09030 [bacterium]|nr:hypothetical protein [bacterium]
MDPDPVNVQFVVEPTVVGGPLAGVVGAVVNDEKQFVHCDGAMIRGGAGASSAIWTIGCDDQAEIQSGCAGDGDSRPTRGQGATQSQGNRTANRHRPSRQRCRATKFLP